ncbi:MAG: glycosyltransferase family 9 protein [Calditrichaceae bacterium]
MSDNSPKILIIRLSSIGDVLLTTPFIRQARIKFPTAQIDFVVKKEFADLIKHNPHINHVHIFDKHNKNKGLKHLLQQIKAVNYNYIFDLHNNFRSKYLLKAGSNAAQSHIKKDKLKRALLVYAKINLYSEIKPIPLRYLDVGKLAGIENDFQGLEIFWKNAVEEKIDRILKERGVKSDYIVFAPGAGFFTKQWPIEYFKDLTRLFLEKREENIIILGGKNEIGKFDSLEISGKVINLTGKLSLLESAAVLSRARAVVSNDSGLMHMASAVKTPVVAIFGSTVKELGFFPYRSNSIIIENRDLKCRPCSHIGRKKCPRGHFKCMLEIEPDLVFKNAEAILTGKL